MGELHEGIAGYLDASDPDRAFVRPVVDYAYLPFRSAAFLGLRVGDEHVSIAGQSVGLPFHGSPVYASGLGRLRFGRGDMALVQNFMPYAFREAETVLDHCILPGYIPFGNLGVMIVVALPDYLIIDRMVEQFQAESFQLFQLGIGLGQETHIKMGGLHNPVGLGGIERRQGFGHIVHRIGVLEMGTEDNHLMGKVRAVGFSGPVRHVRQASRTGSRKQHDCKQKEVFHSAIQFSAANIGRRKRFLSYQSFNFRKIRPGTGKPAPVRA